MRCVFILLYLFTTYTWAETLQPIQLHELPWLSIFIAALIAVWGGLTRTSTRKLAPQEIFGAGVLDAIVAIGAGFVAFNLGNWAGMSIWLLATFIYIAGWLGAQFLSAVGDRFIDAVKGIGKTP